MVDLLTSKFKLTLNGANLEALETSQFLDIAIQLIQARKFELERINSAVIPSTKVDSMNPLSHAVEISGPSNRVDFTETKKTPGGRWFRDRFLEVRLSDGKISVLRSLDELKAFIDQRGLTPHPRGDASMLIWQLRNRLGFEAVAIAPDYQ